MPPSPQLNSKLATPLYLQLKQWFIRQIKTGQWQGSALPSERVLSETFGVSRDTIRRAVNSLERDGLIEKRHGKGNFVSPVKVTQSLSRLSGFSENMRQAGLEPGSKLVSQSLETANDTVCEWLALTLGSTVAIITRLRLVAGEAIMLERSHIPYSLTPGLLEHDLSGSLYSILTDSYHLTLSSGEESLELATADAKTAGLLGIASGEALFYTRRLVKTAKGVPTEYAERFARADKCKFTVNLSGDQADFTVKH